MPDTTPEQFNEQFAAILEELIAAVGRGIGQAQIELDRSSIAIQQAIDADPVLSLHGILATWYQMPRTELDIKVALTIQSTEEAQPVPPTPSAPLPTAALQALRLYVEPVNARYQNLFNFDASATSTLSLTIVPVPPRVTDTLQRPSRLTEEEARTAATPHLEKKPNSTELREDARIVANFNASSRKWYVVQFTEVHGVTSRLAVVEVDDETRQATRS